MESEIKERNVERVQFYWKCPKCDQEIKGNALKTIKHLRELHEKLYCKE